MEIVRKNFYDGKKKIDKMKDMESIITGEQVTENHIRNIKCFYEGFSKTQLRG